MLINIIISILMVLLGIVCLILIGLVLLQKTKGQGAISFGGGAEAVFGANMGNVLTRATVIFGITFLVITTALTVLRPQGRSMSFADKLESKNTPSATQSTPDYDWGDYSSQPLDIPLDLGDGTVTIPGKNPDGAPPPNNRDRTLGNDVELPAE